MWKVGRAQPTLPSTSDFGLRYGGNLRIGLMQNLRHPEGILLMVWLRRSHTISKMRPF